MKIRELSEKHRKAIIWFIYVFLSLGIITSYTYRGILPYSAKQIVLENDTEGYYQYLPHFFIKDWDQMDNMPWTREVNGGKRINMFTSGVAIMQAPFFLTAHFLSHFFELETTGYTSFYYVFVFFAALFYVLVGLLYVYKFLRFYFSHRTAFWSMVLIFFATNLFYYTYISPGMSHAYSFCLMAIFVYSVPIFYQKPSIKNLAIISSLLALATLIRPTNLIIALFLFLYSVFSWKDLKNRFLFWIKKWYFLVLMLLIGLVVFTPQMIYWHHVTGKFIFYSYMNEGFSNYLSPKIYTVLLGPRNGWYIYTPLMLIATIGLFILAYKRELSSWVILFILAAIVYINSSWWVPTFAASAGYRTLIEYFAFMVIPFAWVFENVYVQKRKYIRIAFTSLLIIFVVYNILFSFKYDTNQWWNVEWQWSNFLRLVRF